MADHHYDDDAITDEFAKIFQDHGLVGVVSFVRITDAGSPEDYDAQGTVAVLGDTEDLEVGAAALRQLRKQLPYVVEAIDTCESEARQSAATIQAAAKN